MPPPQAIGSSCFTFCCMTGFDKYRPMVASCSLSPSLITSLSKALGLAIRTRISCYSICIRGSNPSSCLCNSRPCTASCRAQSILAFRAVRKIHATVPAAVDTVLSSKWELITCNTFSRLSGDRFTTSQSSTGAHTGPWPPGTTYYVRSGHWLPPSIGTSGSSPCWES